MTTATLSPAGRTYRFVLGELRVLFTFASPTKGSFVVTDGAGLAPDGHTENVELNLVELAPGVFLNSWQEATGATVTHVEDYNRGVLHSNVTLPDGSFHRLTGTIEALDAQTGPVTNTEIVMAAMRELFIEGDVSAVDRYWAEPYIQHSSQMPNGLDTLRSIIPTLEGFSWTPHRVAAQDDLVMTHSRVLGWAPAPVVIVDIFRLESGRIVEHWDVVQEEVPADLAVNGNPMV